MDCVQHSLRDFMYRNAIFMCERLCAEFPSEVLFSRCNFQHTFYNLLRDFINRNTVSVLFVCLVVENSIEKEAGMFTTLSHQLSFQILYVYLFSYFFSAIKQNRTLALSIVINTSFYINDKTAYSLSLIRNFRVLLLILMAWLVVLQFVIICSTLLSKAPFFQLFGL